MTEYRQVTYSEGWCVKVTPEDRMVDVLHFLTTGGLLGGRSLDGVTWEEVEDKTINRRAAALRKAMGISE